MIRRRDSGPPDKKTAAPKSPTQEPAATQLNTSHQPSNRRTADSTARRRRGGIDAHELAEQVCRRRLGAARSEPLQCGHRDPLTCLARRRDKLTDCQLDGWRDAAAHLLAVTGHTPILPPGVARALWRRGGSDRALAQSLYELAGGDT